MLLFHTFKTLNTDNIKRSSDENLFIDTLSLSTKKLPKTKLTLSQLEELDNNPKEYMSLTKSKTMFNRDFYKKELNSLSIKLFGDNSNTNYKYKRHNRNLNI